MITKWQFKNYQEFKEFTDTDVASFLSYSTSPVFGSKDIFVRIWCGTMEDLEDYKYKRIPFWKPLIWDLSYLTYDSETKNWDVV